MFIAKRNPFVASPLVSLSRSNQHSLGNEIRGPWLQFITNFNSNYYSRLTHRARARNLVNRKRYFHDHKPLRSWQLQLATFFSFLVRYFPDNMWKPCSTSVKFLLSNEYFNIRVINVFPREQLKSIHFFSRRDINRNDRSRFHITRVYVFFFLRRNYSITRVRRNFVDWW